LKLRIKLRLLKKAKEARVVLKRNKKKMMMMEIKLKKLPKNGRLFLKEALN